jgi:hypothetical protein
VVTAEAQHDEFWRAVLFVHMLTPLLRMDFQALTRSQYVVPQFLKPRQAHFGHRDEWDFETSQQM